MTKCGCKDNSVIVKGVNMTAESFYSCQAESCLCGDEREVFLSDHISHYADLSSICGGGDASVKFCPCSKDGKRNRRAGPSVMRPPFGHPVKVCE